MNKTISDIVSFWKRNKILIISFLVVLAIADWGTRALLRPKSSTAVQKEFTYPDEEYKNENYENKIKIYEDNNVERTPQHNPFPIMLLLLLTAAVIYYLYRKGKLDKYIPGFVLFNAILIQEQTTQQLLMKLNVQNKSRETLTFMSPNIVFKRITGKQRKFIIKNNTFPLTLTPGTGQTLTFNIDKFWPMIPELKGFNYVRAEIETSSGKKYKTLTKPKWWISKTV